MVGLASVRAWVIRLPDLRAVAAGLLFAAILAPPASAQDTRTVTEPSFPPPCVELQAKASTPDDAHPDTARIQDALDHCAAGHAVKLTSGASGGAFVTGPIQLRAGVTLLVNKGATLYASRNPRDYDLNPGSCGTVTKTGHGCKPVIAGTNIAHAGVMGEGTIDGRGGEKLGGQNISWWDLAQEAKVKNENQSCPRILVLSHADDFTLYKITLRNSPNFHVSYSNGNGFTAWGVIVDSPRNSRNTDGIDPGNSTNVTITHCFINTGDDNVAIKAGHGAPTTHMTISHNHFYAGHGMSIGSETDGGSSAIRVTDLSIDGADNGIRIKSNASRGGLVRDVIYEDICIRNTKNPILMDSNYSATGLPAGVPDKLPMFTDITLRNVRIDGAGKLTFNGYDAAHKLGMLLDGVTLSNPPQIQITGIHADIALGPGPVNLRPTGQDVRYSGAPGKGTPNACEDKFAPFPAKLQTP
ncbi:MAG TPA: glycosyl hydrolase family 28 protein [Bryobacteraceae bacterium]|nr:glycosyl hydrolase family 28 protein [Bryobacteraceae bacterium]